MESKESSLPKVGEVLECRHCNGTGKCACAECQHPDFFRARRCLACGGKGYVWIGAEHVTLINR